MYTKTQTIKWVRSHAENTKKVITTPVIKDGKLNNGEEPEDTHKKR